MAKGQVTINGKSRIAAKGQNANQMFNTADRRHESLSVGSRRLRKASCVPVLSLREPEDARVTGVERWLRLRVGAQVAAGHRHGLLIKPPLAAAVRASASPPRKPAYGLVLGCPW